MNEKKFNHHCGELVKEEVEIITLQGTFSGRLLNASPEVIVLESTMRGLPIKLAIRVEAIVAIYKVELMPRGPFGFSPRGPEFEQESSSESSAH